MYKSSFNNGGKPSKKLRAAVLGQALWGRQWCQLYSSPSAQFLAEHRLSWFCLILCPKHSHWNLVVANKNNNHMEKKNEWPLDNSIVVTQSLSSFPDIVESLTVRYFEAFWTFWMIYLSKRLKQRVGKWSFIHNLHVAKVPFLFKL